MDIHSSPELSPYLLTNVQRTDTVLGVGSFGSVEEVSFNGAVCAGKKMHDVLLLTQNKTRKILIKKLVDECRLMSSLKHPNIVQFFGLCFLDNSTYPMIVMEKLNSNLDTILTSYTAMPIALKIIIMQDIAKGLNYLHTQSPPVIHRDLTARNVLLTSSMSAKLADLGNARIIQSHSIPSTLSQMPGTLVYMPPEALHHNPQYNASLDIFSFGHLILYIVLQEFPADLLPYTYPDPANPGRPAARTELERRKQYVDKCAAKLGKKSSLMTQVCACLDDIPSRRPSAGEILEQLMATEHSEKQVYGQVRKLISHAAGAGAMGGGVYEPVGSPEGEGSSLESGKSLSQQMLQQIRSGEPMVLHKLEAGKQGMFRKDKPDTWEQYAFRLEDTHLRYYGDLKRRPLGEIELSCVTEVKKIPHRYNYPFEIHFTGRNSPWQLRARTGDVRNCWMENILPKSAMQAEPISSAGSEYAPIKPVKQQAKKKVPMNVDAPKKKLIERKNSTGSNVDESKKRKNSTESNTPLSPTTKYNTCKGNIQISSPSYGEGEPVYAQPFEHVKQLPKVSDAGGKAYALEPTRGKDYAASDGKQPPNTSDTHVKRYAQPKKHSPNVNDVRDKAYASSDARQSPLVNDACGKDYAPPDNILASGQLDDFTDEQIEQMLSTFKRVLRQRNGTDSKQDQEEDLRSFLTDSMTSNISVEESSNEMAPVKPPPIPPKKRKRSTGHATTEKIELSVTEAEERKFVEAKDPFRQRTKAESRRRTSIRAIMKMSAQLSKHMDPLAEGDEDGQWKRASIIQEKQESTDSVPVPDDLLCHKSSIQNMKLVEAGQFGNIFTGQMLYGDGTSIKVTIKKAASFNTQRIIFTREMDTLARLMYPNIALLHGLIPDENIIVFEHMMHGSLSHFLQHNPRPEKKLVKFMMDIAMGMNHLADLHLAHGDLAARNILVSEQEICKVACNFSNVPQAGNQTSDTTKMYSRWCAPEYLKHGKCSTASDVWSFGIIMWEMAYPGWVPYDNFSDEEVVDKIKASYTPTIPYDYPKGVQDIMRQCWSIKPDERPSFFFIHLNLSRVNPGRMK